MFLLAGKSVPRQMQDLPQVGKEQHHRTQETYHSKEFKTTITTKTLFQIIQKIKKRIRVEVIRYKTDQMTFQGIHFIE